MNEEINSQRDCMINDKAKKYIENIEWRFSSSLQPEIIIDYSLDALNSIDRLIDFDYSQSKGIYHNRTMLWIAEGIFLGRMIERNLGGGWIYPSDLKLNWYQYLSYLGVPIRLLSWVFPMRIQIKLNGKTIPIMKIARLRMKLSERVYSLSSAFEEIRRTGKWTGEIPLSPLEKRILSEKKQMWKIEKRKWLYDPRNHNSKTINQFIRRIMFDREFIRTGDCVGRNDYSPEGLREIDEYFSIKNLKERLKEPRIAKNIFSELGEKNLFLLFCRGVGGYLGEVVVRCLGGEWVYPTNKDFLEGLKRHQDIKYLHDRCFVRLGGSLIPVMTIAQLRLDEKIPSLAEVYERIKTTGKWE